MIPRQEFIDPVLLMAVYDSGERAGEVGLWINGIELARLDERGDGCPIPCSHVVPGEESVLPIERYRPDSSLDTIVVDLDPTVGQEDAEAIPIFGDVGERLAKRRLASDAGTMLREPSSHVRNQWR